MSSAAAAGATVSASAFLAAAKEAGIAFFTGVPDSVLGSLCTHMEAALPASAHVIAANEGNAVGLAAGYHFATGGVPLVYLQNSGLGNIVNPVMSMAHPEVYSAPMVLLIGWRGADGEKDEPQHLPQGRITPEMLRVMGIDAKELDAQNPVAALRERVERARTSRGPVALLIRRGVFASEKKAASAAEETLPARSEVLRAVLEGLPKRATIFATTGFASRSLYALRKERNEDPALDFLNVGAMGHASSIAAGFAIGRPDRTAVVIDGDGAALMHLGSLATIGAMAPQNLLHIVLDNEAHESVGGAATVSRTASLDAVASACGYRSVHRTNSVAGVRELLSGASTLARPAFVLVKTRKASTEADARPDRPLPERHAAFLKYVRADS